MKEQFEARLCAIYFGESDKWQGKPLHEAILAKCLELGWRTPSCIEALRLRKQHPDSSRQPLEAVARRFR